MDHQKRFVLFLTLALGILIFWTNYVLPRFVVVPNAANEAANQAIDEADANPAFPPDAVDTPALDTTIAAERNPDESQATATNVEANPDEPDAKVATATPTVDLLRHPPTTAVIGSLDPESGYFLQVTIESRGAAISAVRLSDPRYRELTSREQALQLVGDSRSDVKTLGTSVDAIDAQLSRFRTSLPQIHWELADTTADAAGVTNSVEYRFRAPDKSLEVTKRYSLQKIEASGSALVASRDTDPSGYIVRVELTLRNLSEAPINASYGLHGPVGVRLENEEHARKFREIKVGFVDEGRIRQTTMPAKEVLDQFDEIKETAADQGQPVTDTVAAERMEAWKKPFKYIGIDVQYFAVLLSPLDPRPIEESETTPWIAVARPALIEPDTENPTWSDITITAESRVLEIPAGGEVTHAWSMFAGPKRDALLTPEPFAAEQVLEYGWFGIVAKSMLSLLGFLHSIGLPYAVAIVCMTVMVRGIMFPISRKQALSAKRMRELQPEIERLKKQYEKDKERFSRETWALYSRNNCNPLGGCLPMVLQLPIFIGLYTALNASVDLRLERFLWIENLAAPDAVARLPFRLPFLGQDFSILPIFAVGLFLMQQKMFMPPPTDEQQEMQQKMMNMMTFMFGFFFWHFPAGLCIYIISSSLWGICERKLLDRSKQPALALGPDTAAGTRVIPATATVSRSGQKSKPDSDRPPSFMERLLAAAQDANQTATQKKQELDKSSRKSGKNGKKNKSKR